MLHQLGIEKILPTDFSVWCKKKYKVLMLVNNQSGPPVNTKWNIYDTSANTVSTAELNYALGSRPITVNNQIYLGGGLVRTGTGYIDYLHTCGVWKFQF